MPWSALVSWPFSDPAKAQFHARKFGVTLEDTNLDFRRGTRPFLITRLLTGCLCDTQGKRYSEQQMWDWSIIKRLQGLLAIGVNTIGEKFDIVASCPGKECEEVLEFQIKLSSFEHNENPAQIKFEPQKGVSMIVRSPTGDDQRNWWRNNYFTQKFAGRAEAENEEEVEIKMATDLVCLVDNMQPPDGWRVEPAWTEAMGLAIAEVDPHNDPTISTECPFCHHAFKIDFDLELEILRGLEKVQPVLTDQIHKIASAYHWSESQILDLPVKRRLNYLARIEARSEQ